MCIWGGEGVAYKEGGWVAVGVGAHRDGGWGHVCVHI